MLPVVCNMSHSSKLHLEVVLVFFCREANLIWNQVLPLTACASPSFCDPVLRGKQEIMNWLICRGRFRGGQRRGSGSELSIWDYPDLMGGIKWPMGGNPLSIQADFVTLMCDVILQEPFRGSACEPAQLATRWQYLQFHATKHREVSKSCDDGQ